MINDVNFVLFMLQNCENILHNFIKLMVNDWKFIYKLEIENIIFKK